VVASLGDRHSCKLFLAHCMDHNANGISYDVDLENDACPVIATLNHHAEKPMVCIVYRASAWCIFLLLAMPLLLGNVTVQCCG